jgi:hypothetical protein
MRYIVGVLFALTMLTASAWASQEPQLVLDSGGIWL